MSTLTVFEELREALEYMVDVHHSDVAVNADDIPHFQLAAYYKAIGALRRAAAEPQAAKPLTRMDKSRLEVLKTELRLPVKQMLGQERDVIGARLVAGVGVLAQLQNYSEDDRIKKAHAYRLLATRFALLSYQAAAPLPSSDACICRACQVVVLPVFGGSYEHCGRLWQSHRNLNHHALPGGFWDRHKPGDKFTKQLEGPLDGRGRIEIIGEAV
jgi:hypothetical protein